MKSRNELKKLRSHEDNKTTTNGTFHDNSTERSRRQSSVGVLGRAMSRKHSPSREKRNSEFRPSDPLQGNRKLVLEGLVQICKGSTIKERCIFLYNDLLVIAKEKSRDKYSLKEWIKLSEMWLDVNSVPQFLSLQCLHHLSFVIGWPNRSSSNNNNNNNNQVAIFTSKNIRDIWFQVLHNHISVARDKDKSSLTIKITLDDLSYSVTKSLMVGNKETAHELVERCINEFRLQSRSSSDYELHISTGENENSRPLHDFESPFLIYTDLLRSSKYSSLVDVLPEIKLLLISKIKVKASGERTTPKNKMALLRRMLSKGNSIGRLFGRDLSEISDHNQLCPALMTIMGEIYVNGPISTGIFRKCASPSIRSIRCQLDSGDETALDDVHIHDMASLLKEFLRSMPDCLLTSSLYSDWVMISSTQNKAFLVEQIKRLLYYLPQSHLLLLKHLLCILNSVAQFSEVNLMTPYNIAVCISQCLLWQGEHSSPSSMSNVSSIHNSSSCTSLEQYNDIAKMNLLVQFLIENTAEIFGPECLTLFDHLSRRRDLVIATGSNFSQRSTDSDSSQTSITALKPKNSPTFGFLKSGPPKLKPMYTKKAMYSSTPLLNMNLI